ncbi:MAG: hypothetical protein ACI4S4_01085 [Candidatus Ornithospirochaeta sp.]
MKKVLLIILATFLVFLSSCTTVSFGTRPSWIDSKPEIAGMKVFVGGGVGKTEAEARSNAVGELLSQIGDAIGYDVRDKYFRELYSARSIQDLGAEIRDEYSWKAGDDWTVYLAVTAQEEIFDAARSPEYLETQKRDEKIRGYIDASLEAYKANKDMAAVENLLEAAIIALEGNGSGSSYDPMDIIDKAIGYLEKMRIEESKGGKNVPSSSLVFKVVRTKGILYPAVEEALVSCTYRAANPDGGEGEFRHIARTDSKGKFVFNRTNPYALHQGEIVFSVHIDDDLMFRLGLKADKAILDKISDALEKSNLVYSCSFPQRLEGENVLVAIAEYSIDGTLMGEDGVFSSVLSSIFSSHDIELGNVVYADGEDMVEMVESLLSEYPDMERIFILRMGVVSRTEAGDMWYSRTEGSMTTIYPETGETEVMEDFYYAAGGKSPEEADRNSLTAEAQIISGFLLGEF